ncbi:MAG TPA: DNA cytosine methyltransferase [Bacillota bacterium]|nr:DNA cytosine methyltransferase [Bacillota bacterium]
MIITDHNQMKIRVVNFCCGIGGQDLGFEQSEHEYKGIQGTFETLAGYDNDPVVCHNFERITGNKAICADLFNREQYILFHGEEPGSDWHELTPEDVRKQCRETPDMIMMSPPCKGFSRLLPKKTSQLPKYQALNMLPERIFDLALEAWFDDLPAILLMENVPGIRDKGRGLETLKKIKSKLALRGYVFHEDLYDCGEWGGLGQHRTRFLLIARLKSKVPSFVFEPPKLPMKTIGDILGPLPMPGDTERCGRLHRMQHLAWRTWERLALIPAGKDWRALENYGHNSQNGAYRIVPWTEPSSTVTSKSNLTNNTSISVADPRIECVQGYGNKYKVTEADKPAPTVTGSRVGSGAIIYADPKAERFAANSVKVQEWDQPSGAVLGAAGVNQGSINVSDPRYTDHYHCFKVTPFDEPADTVTSGHSPTSGAVSIADPRIDHPTWRRTQKGKVQEWEKPSGAILGSADLSGAGSGIIADPRLNKRDMRYAGTYKVVEWNEPSPTIIGQTDIQNGAACVSDPRISEKWSGAGNYGVMDWNEPSKTITASGDIHAGASAVADPRIPGPDERGVFIIIAADGTWHRPITTYEGAMLQGFPRTLRDGTPFDLVDCNDGKAREYIGNAVPVQTATAIGNALLATLMPNLLGEWYWGFSDLNIWVKKDGIENITHYAKA